MSHYSYLLTDPLVGDMDVNELARLSDELQRKLFGTGPEGEVALLLFEGSHEVVVAFAALDAAELDAALQDPSLLPAGGRFSRIISPKASCGAATCEPEPEPEPCLGPDLAGHPDGCVDPIGVQPEFSLPALEGLQGVYFTPREIFTGDVISSTPGRARHHLSLLEGADHMPEDPAAFDADCVVAAMRYLGEGVSGALFIPVSYSNIVRLSQRDDYVRMLEVLPSDHRKQFTATVYGTPRDPAYGCLSQVRAALTKYFAHIDLQTDDPGFEVEKLPMSSISSVTLILPEAEPRARLAVLKRFADRMGLYKQRSIWQGVTNVRSKVELAACIALKVPFVTGAAVCRMQTGPMAGRFLDLAELPVLAT